MQEREKMRLKSEMDEKSTGSACVERRDQRQQHGHIGDHDERVRGRAHAARAPAAAAEPVVCTLRTQAARVSRRAPAGLVEVGSGGYIGGVRLGVRGDQFVEGAPADAVGVAERRAARVARARQHGQQAEGGERGAATVGAIGTSGRAAATG